MRDEKEGLDLEMVALAQRRRIHDLQIQVKELLFEQIVDIEKFELRIAELIKERDEYDARRREAMNKIEEYRKNCWKLEEEILILKMEKEAEEGGNEKMEKVKTLDQAMYWFLKNSSGNLLCVRDDGTEKIVNSYPEAERFYNETRED